MNTIGELMKFLATFLEGKEQMQKKNTNKHYKRFTRLIQSLIKHFEKNGFTWEALESFEPHCSQNKAKYGQQHPANLSVETKESLETLIQELKELIIIFEKAKNCELEIRVTEFIKNSAQSVLDETFCTDQKAIIEKLKEKAPEMAA